MSRGRTFGGESKIYGQAAVAALIEEKPSIEGASLCQVWSYDKDYYEQTGQVKKIEFLRTEKPSLGYEIVHRFGAVQSGMSDRRKRA